MSCGDGSRVKRRRPRDGRRRHVPPLLTDLPRGAHPRLEHRDAPELVELRRVGFVIERAGDQHVEIPARAEPRMPHSSTVPVIKSRKHSPRPRYRAYNQPSHTSFHPRDALQQPRQPVDERSLVLVLRARGDAARRCVSAARDARPTQKASRISPPVGSVTLSTPLPKRNQSRSAPPVSTSTSGSLKTVLAGRSVGAVVFRSAMRAA